MTWADVNKAAKYCPVGKYCLAKTDGTTIVPLDCTTGTYCAGNNIEMVVCDGGSYTDANNQSTCKTCTTGSYCPWTPGVLTTPASQLTSCPQGHKCSVASLHQPEPCPPGQYQNTGGQTACLPCPAKFYCPLQGQITPVACPDTMKCPEGSIKPI